jgi:hypothetical protein
MLEGPFDSEGRAKTAKALAALVDEVIAINNTDYRNHVVGAE